MSKEEKTTYNLDTMVGVGKKVEIAGREYEILPVNIEDMVYIIGDNSDERIIIPDEEEFKNNPTSRALVGYNLQGTRKKIFLKILSKYAFYKEKPMTEKLLIEHNWSFKEIKEFLFQWVQISE